MWFKIRLGFDRPETGYGVGVLIFGKHSWFSVSLAWCDHEYEFRINTDYNEDTPRFEFGCDMEALD